MRIFKVPFIVSATSSGGRAFSKMASPWAGRYRHFGSVRDTEGVQVGTVAHTAVYSGSTGGCFPWVEKVSA